MSNSQNFSFWVPTQAIICKGGENGADKSGKRWIQGIASTADVDLQGEIVEQDGIDFSYFLKYGYFNDDHKSGPDNKIGEPTEAKITKKGLWVKGFLYKNSEAATKYWNLMLDQEASESRRRVGFSIQGKTISRSGARIKKCWIQDVAVTTAPVNSCTWAEIVKSLNNMKWDFNKSLDRLPSQQVSEVSKSLSFPEAVAYLQAFHKLPKPTAELVAKVVFQSKGAQI